MAGSVTWGTAPTRAREALRPMLPIEDSVTTDMYAQLHLHSLTNQSEAEGVEMIFKSATGQKVLTYSA